MYYNDFDAVGFHEKAQSQMFDGVKKQHSRGVFRKRCSENVMQICKRTPMPKYDFNKVALQLY